MQDEAYLPSLRGLRRAGAGGHSRTVAVLVVVVVVIDHRLVTAGGNGERVEGDFTMSSGTPQFSSTLLTFLLAHRLTASSGAAPGGE